MGALNLPSAADIERSHAGCARCPSGSRESRTPSTGSRSASRRAAGSSAETGSAAIERRLDEITHDIAALARALAARAHPMPRAQERLTVTDG